MEQLRWFWLAIFLVSLTWLGVNYSEFIEREPQIPTAITQSISDIQQSKERISRDTTDDIPILEDDDSTVFDGNGDTVASIQNVSGRLIRVETDVFSLLIDQRGGTIIRADLKKFPISIEQKDIPTELLNEESYNIQSGLVSKQEAPTHDVLYDSPSDEYFMEGNNILEVPLIWQENGLRVVKTYRFKPNSYAIEMQTSIENNGSESWSGNFYAQLMRDRPRDEESSRFIYTYTGPAIYTGENNYEKISFDDIDSGDGKTHQSLGKKISDPWVAMLQHYFLAALVPNESELVKLFARKVKDKYYIGYTSERIVVPVGETATLEQNLFIGPTEQSRLTKLHPDLNYAVDYGVFHVIAAPLFWVLKNIHSFVGNWGFSIILVTMLIKLVFFKLSEKSYRSMAKMRKLSPRIQQLRERYSDDKQELNKRMMSIYKDEKVNPLGGCLPVLVQIPVFISLYWVLIESVELRQAPFILWIHDLSIADPYFVLPLMMGVSMWFQQRLNPAPPDPIQAKVMQFLPVIFTVFFLFFPAGLVLYWVTNNVLSIAQQWVITKRVEAEK